MPAQRDIIVALLEQTRGGISEGFMTPLWAGELLLLARRVSVNGDQYIQGCWLDWASLKDWLLPSVRDLLPEADLDPVRLKPAGGQERLLASLPARFLPGPAPEAGERFLTPLRLSLTIAWACVLLAGLATAFLLLGTIALGELKTHEALDNSRAR